MKHYINPLSLLAFFILIGGCAGLRIDRQFRPAPYDWLTYGGGPSRSNNSFSVVEPPLHSIWEYNANAGIAGSPLIRDSVLVVVTLQGEIQAADLSTGKRLGYLVLESTVGGTPAWDGNSILVPLAAGKETLVSLGFRFAERFWSAAIGPIESSPLLSGEYVYATTLEGNLYCLNRLDGTEVWKFAAGSNELQKPIRSSPATDGESIFFGCDDGLLYAVDAKDGTLRWKVATGASIFATPVVVESAVVVGSLDGTLYCVDGKDGAVRWKFSTGSKIYGSASACDSLIFFGSADGVCHALTIAAGFERWSFTTRSVINCAPLVAGNLIYLGSTDRTLYALRKRSGEEVWRFEAPGRIKVSPVIWGSLLLLTSEDKYIIALQPGQLP